MGLALKTTIAPKLRGLMLALALAVPGIQAAPSRPQTQEEIFLAARVAARAGDYDKLASYDAQLRGYLLEPYVESWLLRPRLEDAAAEEVRAFLARQQGSLLAEQVRTEWLKVLGKKQQWDLFRSEHPLLVSDDNEISCYALQARWRQKDALALAEVRTQWYAPRELPEGCVPLAEVLIASGQFANRQVWERIRLLLEAGAVSAAWHTAGYLPPGEALDRGQLFGVAAGPQRYLDDRKKDLSRRQVRSLKARLGIIAPRGGNDSVMAQRETEQEEPQ